ncbi:MAG TPA: hypothetical protein VIJ04_11485 [Xanthobacteraceae bacterium]
MEILAIVIIVVFGAIGAFIWQQTKAKGRWGLGSVGGTNCPRCGTRLLAIRKPTSMQEFLWGGSTCSHCGCKVDKYGREITPS